MKQTTRWTLVIFAALGVSVSIVAFAAWPRGAAEQADGQPTAVVQRRDFTPRVLATGNIRLRSGARVNVGARISGVVVSLPVSQGSRVERNDIIARLDDREERKRVELADAAVAELEASIEQLSADLARSETLARDGGITQQELLAARTALTTARARLAGATSSRALAILQLEYTVIRAPISGIVGSVTTHEGETVSASLASPTFVTLLDPSRIECVALVDESDIGRVRVTNPVEFTVDAYPSRVFHGIVIALAPDATVISGVVDYETTVRVLDGNGDLRPQMTASVAIAGAARTALILPSAAVRQAASGAYVWRRNGSAPAQTPVTLGSRQGELTEVRSGLAQGDTVLTGGFPER